MRRSRVMYAWASARGLREGEVRRGPSVGVVDKSKIFLRDGRLTERCHRRRRSARRRRQERRGTRRLLSRSRMGADTHLPRVPILTRGSSSSATTRMAPRDLTEALTRLAATGIAAEKAEERAPIFLPEAAGATRAETAADDIMAAILTCVDAWGG